MERNDSFKNRFNEALSKSAMKPADLSRLTHISEATISQYRSGYSEPKTDRLGILASALRVNPAWLMGIDDNPFPARPKYIVPNFDNILEEEIPELAKMSEPEKPQDYHINPDQVQRLMGYILRMDPAMLDSLEPIIQMASEKSAERRNNGDV